LRAPAPLRVEVVANPNATVANASVVVRAAVSGNGAPVRGATVSFASSGGGRFLSSSAVTGPTGEANVSFVAPAVGTATTVRLAASASASGTGFLPGNGSANLTVEPGGHVLSILPSFPQGTSVPSGASLLAVVRVTDGRGTPVAGANVSLGATLGAVDPSVARSSPSGNASFVLHAPIVNATTADDLLFEANASGFANGTAQTAVRVTAGAQPLLSVEIAPAAGMLYQGESIPLVVDVRDGSVVGPAVAGAAVTLVLSDGRYGPVSARTDGAGHASFTYTAAVSLPAGGNATVTILAAVTAPGHAPGLGNATYAVTPMPSGGPGSAGGTDPWSFVEANFGWILLAAAVVAVVLSVVFARRRRSRAVPPSAPAEAPPAVAVAAPEDSASTAETPPRPPAA
jgi:hypothetical protein